MYPQDPQQGGAPGQWQQQGPTPPGWGAPPPQQGWYPPPPGMQPMAAAPKKGVRPWIIVVGVLVWLGVVGAWFAASKEAGESLAKSDDARQTVKSSNGQSQVLAPTSWKTLELHDEGDIEVGNELAEQYLVVISEPREDFAADFDLKRYADVCLTEMRSNLKDSSASAPQSIQVNGRPALRYEIGATIDFVNAKYVVTYVEGAKGYHQVLAWTLKSRWDDAKPVLEAASNSFTEL